MPRFDVTVAGELNLDLILYGLPAELPRERELLAKSMMLTLGSSSAILAHNLAALGSRVGFQSRIGTDELGEIALKRLSASGADTSFVRRSENSNTGLTVILQHDPWRNILTYSGTISELTLADLDLEYLSNSRHFHLSSFYLQSNLRHDVPELFRRLKAAGLTTSLDTNDDPEDRWEDDLRDVLRYVDVLMPNEREACKIAHSENLEHAIAILSGMVPTLVVKLGTKGAIAKQGAKELHSAAVAVAFVDPVGAGDSFDAGFLHEYVQGADLWNCLEFGNLVGALSTTRTGGTEAFRDADYRKNFFREHTRDSSSANKNAGAH
ncbi:MAG: sugar kinase [Acidobacteriaceae bacterium]|nr:sugar kinase [Acidobacteriaceae bacterium]